MGVCMSACERVCACVCVCVRTGLTPRLVCNAKTRDRAGDLQIFGLTLSQLSYHGHVFDYFEMSPVRCMDLCLESTQRTADTSHVTCTVDMTYKLWLDVMTAVIII